MEWKTLQLGELVEIHDSRRVPLNSTERSKIQGEYPYLGANGVVDHINKYIFDGEYLLVAEDGGFFKRYDNSCYIFSGKFWVNNHAHILNANPEKTTNKWLYYFLVSEDLEQYCSGATRLKLTQAKLRSIPIPLPFKDGKPDLAEQGRIADKLDKVFAEIEKGQSKALEANNQTTTFSKSLLRKTFSNSKWKQVSFSELIDSKSKFSLGKIQQKTYQQKGAVAVIDQGKELIAGYTDRKELTYTGKLPVVIFGDHTTAIKYVDFPFVQGADGIKVLVPKNEINPKYLYYSLVNSKPKGGKYARHYKELRKMKYALPFKDDKPDLIEQKSIVDELDKAFALSEELHTLFIKQKKTFVGLRASVLSDAFKPETQTIPVAVPVPAIAPRPFDIQQAVALILKRFERGEMVVAKILYLGQSIYQVPLGIQFSAQNFGPYDSAVKKAVTAGLSPRNKFFAKKGSGNTQVLSLGANASKILKYSNSALARKMNNYLNEMMPHFSVSNSNAIERLATICKIIEDTKTADEKTIKEKLHEWKPNKFQDAEVSHTIAFIKNKKWDAQLVK